MVTMQGYFSNVGTFSQLFEASAEEGRQSAMVLKKLLHSSPNEFNREAFSRIRRGNKQIDEEITALLCQSYVTPLQREDLEALSRALYRIPKAIEKCSLRMLLSKSYVPFDFFDRQARIVAEATGVVYEMVSQLWHQPHLTQIKEESNRLHLLEVAADKLVFEMLRDLYSGESEAIQVIVFHDLLELLEKIIDRCRDAGNIIFHIVLKNS